MTEQETHQHLRNVAHSEISALFDPEKPEKTREIIEKHRNSEYPDVAMFYNDALPEISE